jgi:hypothetical protein
MSQQFDSATLIKYMRNNGQLFDNLQIKILLYNFKGGFDPLECICKLNIVV